ncbi:hypothetical protein LMG32289_05018 [Cupriavidus pampae]|uniref:Uncharacterized protein n=1 Tax=Cupriavidus pampae TaxID=659251 RepID=A0ABM8XP48_9BURK|nr:hypothetical protein LMG32289_05018 [Cupriavidus pampae]
MADITAEQKSRNPATTGPTRSATVESLIVNPQAHNRTDAEANRFDQELDIPFGSLEAAAMAELPYTFSQSGTCARYYNEYFG